MKEKGKNKPRWFCEYLLAFRLIFLFETLFPSIPVGAVWIHKIQPILFQVASRGMRREKNGSEKLQPGPLSGFYLAKEVRIRGFMNALVD